MGEGDVAGVDAAKRLQMDRLLAEARGFGLQLAEVNDVKPWGGYLRFTQQSLGPFLTAYWLDVKLDLPPGKASVDPKILLVAPGKMLSLQWHERRGEIWRVLDGPVRITLGDDWDGLKDASSHRDYATGEVVVIPAGKWHRLIGLEGWGRVAEIWRHEDSAHPSEEKDIHREHDLYDRADSAAQAKWEGVYPFE